MRLDRYREEERKRKLRKRKIGIIIIVLLLSAGIVAECVVLMRITTIDRRFVRNVERGVRAGWDLDNNELQLQKTGKITDVGFINEEFEAIKDYRNHRYKDDDLGKLANEYISAVTECRKAARKHNPEKDYDAFWSEFTVPYGRRIHALYTMQQGDFKMDLDKEEYEDEYSNLIAQGWLMGKLESAEFIVTEEKGAKIFETSFLNESGYNINYLNIEVVFLNSEGRAIEHSAAFVENIENHGLIELKFSCTSKKAVKYQIVGQTCKLGDKNVEL